MFGFESSAIYGEEAKDPKRTVARATVIVIALITVFFGFTSWMLIVGYGPSRRSTLHWRASRAAIRPSTSSRPARPTSARGHRSS